MSRRAAAVILSLVLAGCSGGDADTQQAPPTDDTLAPPDVGVQLVSTPITLASGTESYTCWSFQVPEGTELPLIKLDNLIAEAGVHHYAVFTSAEPLPESKDPYECYSMGIAWGLVSGGGLGTPPVTFPEGTAMTIAGGTHLILQLHLLNGAGADLEVKPSYINLVGAPSAENLEPVGLLIAGSLDIDIPAHTSGFEVSGGCAAPEPLENIFAVFPHMHQLGRRITSQLTPAGKPPITLSDQAWDFGDQGLYEVTGSLAEGDQVTVTCTFDNTTDASVSFGLSSKEEMCIEVLYHYPAKQKSAYCGFGG